MINEKEWNKLNNESKWKLYFEVFKKRKIVHKVFQRAGEYFYVCNQVVNIKQGKYTTNNKLVTCERCLKIMKKKVKINE